MIEATAGRAARRPGSRRNRDDRWAAAVLLAPNVIGFTLFLGVPIAVSVVLSFFDVDGFGHYEFTGLANYVRAFTDPFFTQSVAVTAIYVVTMVPSVFCIGLGLALLTKPRTFGMGGIRAAFFVPHVVSLVVIGLLWQFLLVDKVGVVNRLLGRLGISGISWLGDGTWALGSVIFISVWFYIGYYMIIFLAGLNDIPQEQYEAARMDGAGVLGVFRHVTWPLLKPTSFYVLMVSTVAAISGGQAFDLIYVMTKGGPVNSTALTMFYIYEQAFQYNHYGYACALSALVVITLLIITGTMFLITRGGRFDHV